MTDTILDWPRFTADGSGSPRAPAAVDGQELRRVMGRFARSTVERFAGVPWEIGPLGLPLLQGMAAHLCCRTWARYAGGDHEIMVGEVVFACGWDADPLVYQRGRLTRLAGGGAPAGHAAGQ